MLGILDVFAKNQDTFTAAAGPGHWNDPDMVRFISSAKLWSRFPEGCTFLLSRQVVLIENSIMVYVL